MSSTPTGTVASGADANLCGAAPIGGAGGRREEQAIDPTLTRCGYRCDLCLAFRPNVADHPENRQVLRNGWRRCYEFRISPTEICCDGSMATDPTLIDQNCPVRPWVIEKDLDNCSQCERYACDRLESRLVTFEEVVQQRGGEEIPSADYERFIRPYESERRLSALRRSESAA